MEHLKLNLIRKIILLSLICFVNAPVFAKNYNKSTVFKLVDTPNIYKDKLALDPIDDDTLERFYTYDNREFFVEKIEREHIPLNGKSVSMIPFRVDKLFGFVKKDNPDKWLIKPEFSQVFAVYPEGAIVKKGNYYGLINSKNKWLIQPSFTNLFKEGDIYRGILTGIDTLLPRQYQRCMYNLYYDEMGKLLFYENAHDFRSFTGEDTLAWFRYGSQYKIRSKSGQLVKTFKKSDLTPQNSYINFLGIYDNLLLYVETEDQRSFLYKAYNINGQLAYSLRLDGIYANGIYKLDNSLFGLLGGHGDYYFCDANGKEKPYGIYSYAIGFFNSYPAYLTKNYFVVPDQEKQKLGVINRKGDVLIDFKYNYISSFNDGLALCTTDSQTFLIDTVGEIKKELTDILKPYLIEGLYSELEQEIAFHEGMCVSKELDLSNLENGLIYNYLFIDQNGEVVCKLSPDIIFVGQFSEGLAPAVNKEKALGFIDKTGNWAIQPEYELSLAGAYPLPYLVIPKFIGGFAYIKSFKGYIDKTGKKYFSGERMEDRYNFSH